MYIIWKITLYAVSRGLFTPYSTSGKTIKEINIEEENKLVIYWLKESIMLVNPDKLQNIVVKRNSQMLPSKHLVVQMQQ